MGGGGGGGGGWIKPLQTLSQGLALSFVFCLLALSLTIQFYLILSEKGEQLQLVMTLSPYIIK